VGVALFLRIDWWLLWLSVGWFRVLCLDSVLVGFLIRCGEGVILIDFNAGLGLLYGVDFSGHWVGLSQLPNLAKVRIARSGGIVPDFWMDDS